MLCDMTIKSVASFDLIDTSEKFAPDPHRSCPAPSLAQHKLESINMSVTVRELQLLALAKNLSPLQQSLHMFLPVAESQYDDWSVYQMHLCAHCTSAAHKRSKAAVTAFLCACMCAAVSELQGCRLRRLPL